MKKVHSPKSDLLRAHSKKLILVTYARSFLNVIRDCGVSIYQNYYIRDHYVINEVAV